MLLSNFKRFISSFFYTIFNFQKVSGFLVRATIKNDFNSNKIFLKLYNANPQMSQKFRVISLLDRTKILCFYIALQNVKNIVELYKIKKEVQKSST